MRCTAGIIPQERRTDMVNLKANPYWLSDEDIQWVEETIAGMSDEEKVGQLFFQLTASHDEAYLKELMEKYHLGGCRYNPAPGKAIQEQNRKLQKYAKYRYLLPAIRRPAETAPAQTERKSAPA